MSSEDEAPRIPGRRSPNRQSLSYGDDEARSTAPKKRGRPKGTLRKFQCCDERDEEFSEILICNEEVEEDEAWLCQLCRDASDTQPRQRQQQPQSESSQETTSSQDAAYKVVAIKDKRINPDKNDQIEFLVKWAPIQGIYYSDSWEPDSHMDKDGDLYKEFIDSGEAVYDSEEDQDEHDIAVEAAQRPLDFLQGGAEQSSNPYWSKLQLGYWSVLRTMYEDVLSHSAVEALPDFATFSSIGLEILASMPNKVMRALCGTGLERNKYYDPELRSILSRNTKQAKFRPCIYVIEFTDERGQAPIVSHMRVLIKRARQYLNEMPTKDDIRTARKIDGVAKALTSVQEQEVKNGGRRYLTGSNRQKIKLLLQKLEEQLPPNDTDRVPFVLRDVGYTDHGPRRIDQQHLRHLSSNMVMNLFEAISLSDDVLDGLYRMRGDVIFLCFRHTHAALGEIIISLLAQSYVQTGRGFNGVDARVQQRSNANYQDVKEWSEWQREALNESPIQANLIAENDRIDAFRKRKQGLEREIQQLEREVVTNEINMLEREARVERELQEAFDQLKISNV